MKPFRVVRRDVATVLPRTETPDPLLVPLLAATDAEMRDRAIETIIMMHAQPVAGAILNGFRGNDSLRPEDLDDVSSTITLRLVQKLQQLAAGQGESIASLRDFVATTTYNAVYDAFRRRYPERTRLKNRIRYALLRDPRLTAWTIGDVGAAGLRGWEGRDDFPSALNDAATTLANADRNDLPGVLAKLFLQLGKPLPVDELVALLAEAWNIRDTPPPRVLEATDPLGTVPFLRFETRQYLGCLWQEIRALIPRQRAALLLNLRAPDAVNAVALLVLIGVATVDEVAEAIGIATTRLAEIWNDLPLDDLAIASMLGLERQQVISLRKSARERLTRRMKSNDRPRR
jgi:hypothetical protein